MITPILCTWDDLPLHVVRIRDQIGRTWVRHSYPGRRGVELEDMGGKPAEFDVEVVFFGPNWKAELDEFWTHVAVPLAEGTGFFVHPWWGNFVGVIPEFEVTHEDRKKNLALVRFHFVEADTTPLGFNAEFTLDSALAEAEEAIAAVRAALVELEARS